MVGTRSARKASWPAAHVIAALKAGHMAAPTSRARSDRNHSPTEGRPHKAKLGRDHSEDMLFLNVAGLDRSAGEFEIGVPKIKLADAGRSALTPQILPHLGVRPGWEWRVAMTRTSGSP